MIGMKMNSVLLTRNCRCALVLYCERSCSAQYSGMGTVSHSRACWPPHQTEAGRLAVEPGPVIRSPKISRPCSEVPSTKYVHSPGYAAAIAWQYVRLSA